MMVIDDILLSFTLSYLAGNIPTIKKCISQNKTLHSHIENCYKKALDEWTTNPETKELMNDNVYRHLEDLCDYIQHKPKGRHPLENELLKIWSEKLREDPLCYNFIIENKTDIISSKIDHTEEHLNKQDECLEEIRSMLKNKNNNEEIKKLIRNLLNTNISELIEQLRIDSAFKILMEIEQSHSPVLNSDPLLLAELEYEKGQILQYRNRLEAKKCLQHAYKLNTNDARFIKTEIWNRLKENDITEVKKLLVNLPKDDVTRHAIEVALSNNPTDSFTSEDSFYLQNYAFRQLFLSALEILNKNEYISIVYNIDKIKCPEKLKYSNINDGLLF